ncbi:uncharacterized protein HRG_09867 [Hirsutella rhossiliensis]|uniref:Uncharacterized protein n=1 Tax=Hirsutella rhossiliensis TaxID=111463 RepID=A0A9P8MPR0_9HYPO|nr:uncharacterized protein HRG_09867 [Hirsutella rhossiliensis]KAH0958822.1 hypothetical protein HRG_09867 [Hirsutella rhossiliensis]
MGDRQEDVGFRCSGGRESRPPSAFKYLSRDFAHDDEDSCHRGFRAAACANFFVPWEFFLCEEMGDINSIRARARKALAPRIGCLINNVQLLRRPAEDAERDAKRWASSSGDGHPTVGHVGTDDAGAESTVMYQSNSIGNATRLIDVVRGAVDSN